MGRKVSRAKQQAAAERNSEQGLVHADLQPGNVMRSGKFSKLIDMDDASVSGWRPRCRRP